MKGKGWFNEPLRHSLARKGVKTGRKIVLPKQRNKIFDVEDLTDKELNKLSSQQVKALEKGKPVKLKELLEQAKKEQIKDWEKRYKILSEQDSDESELEKYRLDKADYLQYLHEKKKTDAYIKNIKGTTKDYALQNFGEDLIKDLRTESPTTVKFLRENPDYKIYFVESDDFKNLLIERKGVEPFEARTISGIHYGISKEIYVSVDLNKTYKTVEDGKIVYNYDISPRERAIAKEVLVHEVAHAQRSKNDWDDLKRELRTQITPQIRERWELFKKKPELSKIDYDHEVGKLDKKWGGFLEVPDPEYVAYHYQGRVRRRIRKPFIEEVKRQEKLGDYNLSFYNNEWGEKGLDLPSIEARGGLE